MSPSICSASRWESFAFDEKEKRYDELDRFSHRRKRIEHVSRYERGESQLGSIGFFMWPWCNSSVILSNLTKTSIIPRRSREALVQLRRSSDSSKKRRVTRESFAFAADVLNNQLVKKSAWTFHSHRSICSYEEMNDFIYCVLSFLAKIHLPTWSNTQFTCWHHTRLASILVIDIGLFSPFLNDVYTISNGGWLDNIYSSG